MDFTIETYDLLLQALRLHHDVSIKHDVDQHPLRSLRIAQVEKAANVTATYYFRTLHFDSHASTIKAIAALGHTIGYHYECLAACHGDSATAIQDFRHNLERLRRLVPVHTACAHGSPLSRWDNQSLWNQYDIHSFDISFEPMLDTDFASTLYLTDTGRRWDGAAVSLRDKVVSQQSQWDAAGLSFHSTNQLIAALCDSNHPIHSLSLLINTHPQRWLPFGPAWLGEATTQQAKNIIKRLSVKTKL